MAVRCAQPAIPAEQVTGLRVPRNQALKLFGTIFGFPFCYKGFRVQVLGILGQTAQGLCKALGLSRLSIRGCIIWTSEHVSKRAKP